MNLIFVIFLCSQNVLGHDSYSEDCKDDSEKTVVLEDCNDDSEKIGVSGNSDCEDCQDDTDKIGVLGSDIVSSIKGLKDVSVNANDKEYWEKSFGHTEDADLDFTSLTCKYGYETETHSVTTADGYILNIFRMKKRTHCNSKRKALPVIMWHGLFDSSDTWILAGPKAGLAYMAANRCMDVWLGNSRGNRYAKKNIHHRTHSERFWNFTYDQLGMYDLPATVDYVLEATESKQVNYIGHSQGTTNFYVLASTRPEYNAKFNISISLAPVAWVHHLRNPPIHAIAKASRKIKEVLDLLKIREILSRDDPEDELFKFICKFFSGSWCRLAIMLLAGGDPKEVGKHSVQTAFGHFPCASSSKNLVHFAQGVNVNKFRMYDYGDDEKNLEAYGAVEPPDYALENVTAKVAMIVGKGDTLATVEDVATLRRCLKNVVYYTELDETWGHGHFVWAETIPTRLAPIVFELLTKYGS